MAAVTSSAVSFLSFSGLKAGASATPKPAAGARPAVTSPPTKLTVKASLKDIGAAAVAATAAGAILASNALAIEVALGGDDGSLAFLPKNFEVASGEKIVFRNNAGYPHNVLFDEDGVPAGVNVSEISMGEEDYLNAKDEIYSVVLKEKGTYSFYCAPHQGAGMVGTVTVK